MNLSIALTACLGLAACDSVPELDAAMVDTILSDAPLLLSTAPKGAVERSVWPESIAAISPKSVRVTDEGLYIVTYSFFVEESGFFVARDLAHFEWKQRGDPTFVQIKDALFEYHVTG